MNYSDLVKEVAHEACISQSTTKRVLDALVLIIPDAVKDGKDVVLKRIGKFSKKTRPARDGRNPSTGETIKIASCKQVVFKTAKEFKDIINS